MWKKKLTYKPKKVVVTYYSTYYLSETHYRNYYQNYIHTLVSNTAEPVFRIYQLYSILSVHCFIICIVWIFDSPRSTHLWYIFSYTCPKFYVYIQSCFVTQNSLITSSSQNKQKDVWLLTFIYFKVNFEFRMTKNRPRFHSCFTLSFDDHLTLILESLKLRLKVQLILELIFCVFKSSKNWTFFDRFLP